MTAKFDLVIVGVGGQGTLLASKILGLAALNTDCAVKVSEVHGMAQRGGSVITHVRVGDRVHAPLVSQGQADYVVAFEELEAARAASFLKQDGLMIVNSQQIMPMPVILGAAEYPQGLLDTLRAKHRVEAMDALALAEQAGSMRAVNLVLMGALSRHLPWNESVWEDAIGACVPKKTLEINLRAFRSGRNALKAQEE